MRGRLYSCVNIKALASALRSELRIDNGYRELTVWQLMPMDTNGNALDSRHWLRPMGV